MDASTDRDTSAELSTTIAGLSALGTYEIGEITKPGRLERRLTDASTGLKRKQITVGFFYQHHTMCAAINDQHDRAFPGAPEYMMVGCLTKLFTSSLVVAAISRGHFSLLDDASEVFADRRIIGAESLQGIQIKHLLEHTHGLNQSRADFCPRLDTGRIDARELCARAAAAERIASPGHMYCYGSAGSWLLAALLENIHNQDFEQILLNAILTPLGISRTRRPALVQRQAHVCPSFGEAFAARMQDMLLFLRSNLPTATQANLIFSTNHSQIEEQVVPLPGWSPLEKGIRLGWKYYGSGWYGHNSTFPQASALIRLHPQSGIGIAISSRYQAAFAIASRLFSRILPEFASLSIPMPESTAGNTKLSQELFVGQFCNREFRIDVEVTPDGGLGLKVRANTLTGNAPVIIDVRLIYSANQIFITQPRDNKLFPYVQFVCRSSDKYLYLWNGGRIYKRSSHRVNIERPCAP